MAPTPVRVAVVDDYEIVVHGLARMFDAYHGRVVIAELDADTEVVRPVDIALYDTFAQAQVSDPSMQDLIANPAVGKVVVYSWNLDDDLIRAARALGVHGYLSKSLPAADLVDALERIHAGEEVFSKDPGRNAPVVGGDWPGRVEGLTVREAEIIALITQGMSNAEIARSAHLSINSVKSYIRSAYHKIGVTRRSQAVLWGVRHGFEPDRSRTIRH